MTSETTGPDPADASADASARAAGPVTRWTVVIPAKAPSRGKTRLAPHVQPEARVALARAFATDTISAAVAARGVERVIVVGDDPSLARDAEFLEEPTGIADGTGGPAGLTAAIAHGIAHARSSESGAVAVLLGDLPCLRPADLDAALAAAEGHPLAFVPDADGSGTTLATARPGVGFAPRFGQDSAREHAAAGFARLEASARLRRDVDTLAALEAAIALGTGPATAHAVTLLADGGAAAQA
ncbi:2-phospho-L-lactate guanylyltransferase [Agromyces sp. LHK192]|uniref:2-phospho-L-lactate guanylyltransferase n=1 Tax=Agromyces sp. LHK192 TaxID=2498704 RepID=UPI000FDA8A51|nr:2-phospho-L-lactate guanylyltransferase [Agromyces sp. LHK192]